MHFDCKFSQKFRDAEILNFCLTKFFNAKNASNLDLS